MHFSFWNRTRFPYCGADSIKIHRPQSRPERIRLLNILNSILFRVKSDISLQCNHATFIFSNSHLHIMLIRESAIKCEVKIFLFITQLSVHLEICQVCLLSMLVENQNTLDYFWVHHSISLFPQLNKSSLKSLLLVYLTMSCLFEPVRYSKTSYKGRKRRRNRGIIILKDVEKKQNNTHRSIITL